MTEFALSTHIDRTVRKVSVALLGDEYFAHINPVAFARLVKWRKRKTLIGLLELNMEAAKQRLKERLYADLFGTTTTAGHSLTGLQTAVSDDWKTYSATVRIVK